jgi:hypothetical protein
MLAQPASPTAAKQGMSSFRLGIWITFGVLVVLVFAGVIANDSQGPTSVAVSDVRGDPGLVIPTDSKARYWIVEQSGSVEEPILTTKRVGSSGTTFSRRVFDCSAKTFRYLAEGSTLAGMQSSQPDARKAPLVDGSISHYFWVHACSER